MTGRVQIAVLLALILAVVVSAVGVVHAKYQSRELFVTLQELIRERDAIEEEWGRLQLELGSWGTHVRVERLARDRLQMRLPRADEVVVLRRGGAE
jgi:cell division protein FtsL